MRSYDAETDLRRVVRRVEVGVVGGEQRTSSRRERAVRASPVEREAMEERI